MGSETDGLCDEAWRHAYRLSRKDIRDRSGEPQRPRSSSAAMFQDLVQVVPQNGPLRMRAILNRLTSRLARDRETNILNTPSNE